MRIWHCYCIDFVGNGSLQKIEWGQGMLDHIFGNAALALKLSEARSEILSENITNASTPNYKARDIDFKSLLKAENQSNQASQWTGSSIKTDMSDRMEVLYRQPFQISLNGNTVDAEMERKSFMENAIHYQVGLSFIENKTKELIEAIKGDIL